MLTTSRTYVKLEDLNIESPRSATNVFKKMKIDELKQFGVEIPKDMNDLPAFLKEQSE